MKSFDRLEELADRYVVGSIRAEEVRELEELLRADDSARAAFAEFCMDETLLQNAMAGSGEQHLEWVPSAPPEPARRWSERAPVRAAALLLTFTLGWGLSSVFSPADLPVDWIGRGPRELRPVADLTRPSLPIYYPPAATRAARPVVYPLDFDESGNLSTNPFLQFQPMQSTDL